MEIHSRIPAGGVKPTEKLSLRAHFLLHERRRPLKSAHSNLGAIMRSNLLTKLQLSMFLTLLGAPHLAQGKDLYVKVPDSRVASEIDVRLEAKCSKGSLKPFTQTWYR